MQGYWLYRSSALARINIYAVVHLLHCPGPPSGFEEAELNFVAVTLWARNLNEYGNWRQSRIAVIPMHSIG